MGQTDIIIGHYLAKRKTIMAYIGQTKLDANKLMNIWFEMESKPNAEQTQDALFVVACHLGQGAELNKLVNNYLDIVWGEE